MDNLLDAETTKKNLITIALFIAIYENFKVTIIDRVKIFFFKGLKDSKFIYDDSYKEQVLNKVKKSKNKKLSASLLWFKEVNAINDEDISNFQKITDLRNTLVHDMSDYLFYNSSLKEVFTLYEVMLALFKKIDCWWINEIEIPISGNFKPEDYNHNEVTSLNIVFLEIMDAIALNKDFKHLEQYVQFLKTIKKYS